MAVLVNFKICDNAPECGGIAVCPTGALTYDENKKTMIIDNDKCITCGACEPECPIGSIMVAGTDNEYAEYQKQIDEDPRTIKDLFVDRYGAAPINEFFMIKESELEDKAKSQTLTFIELYDNETIECLLKSIPIKDITDSINEEVLYYNLEQSDSLTKKYNIKNYPCLLVFKAGMLLGKIEGYYKLDEKAQFESEIKAILNN